MTPVPDEVVETDVLVVGGGYAGCWAALRASQLGARVTLVEKARVARSGTTIYCHDLLAPMPEARADDWVKEVMEHAQYMSDQQYVEVLLKEEGQRIRDLEAWGVPFERDERGNLFLSLGRGHKESRVVLCECRKLIEVLKKQLIQNGVTLVQRVMVTDLLTSDGQHPTSGQVVGAVGLHTRTGQLFIFKAKAVILATGIITTKLHFTFADNLCGDGQAMAFRAGAELAGLEFIFNPKFVCNPRRDLISPRSLIPFQTQGAYIVNSLGERFMTRYAGELGERRATFGLLAQAIAKETLEGRGPICFDMRHWSQEQLDRMRRIQPGHLAILDEFQIDPRKDLLPIRLMVTDLGTGGSGGIRINLTGEGSIPGLFAGGVAAQFPGCAEFLSGGYLAFCSVFGYRAGEQAAKISREGTVEADLKQIEELKGIIFSPLKRKTSTRPKNIYHRLSQRIVRPEYSLIKTEQTIKDMLTEIRKVAEQDLPLISARDIHELVQANEARNFITILEPIYLSALERKESRLTHYRLDYPYRDDIEWLKWVVVKKTNENVQVSHYPVPLEENRVKPPERARVPAPIQFSVGFGK